ncbi:MULTISPECIES: hypothetical protein [Halorussus]|uniref:hypothetical protein n=1 Tax=Halorussus TaxID=1070314 RepID=UPI0020A03863|nr:hypothetical protein [Halorussus vallis]USZ74454.1 hypothetical protein NGM07_13480 [Halorussus vallis]
MDCFADCPAAECAGGPAGTEAERGTTEGADYTAASFVEAGEWSVSFVKYRRFIVSRHDYLLVYTVDV